MSIDTTGLRRLRAHRDNVAEKLEDLRAQLAGYTAALAEELPAPPDREAASRRVAAAVARDALESAATADEIRSECERECRTAEAAVQAAKARRAIAAVRKVECEAAIRELKTMLDEADRAVREALAEVGKAMLAERKAAVYKASEQLVEAWAEWRAAAGLAAQGAPEEVMRRVHGFAMELPACESGDTSEGVLRDFLGYNGIAISEHAGSQLASRAFTRLRAELLGEEVTA